MTELAIVGAGVAGCALAAQLRRQGWSGSINLLEIGRGPGGRAATRRSRRDPALAINHGAPLFNITGSPPPALLAPLRQGDWIQPFTGVIQALDGEGRLIEAHGAGECASECAAEGFHADSAAVLAILDECGLDHGIVSVLRSLDDDEVRSVGEEWLHDPAALVPLVNDLRSQASEDAAVTVLPAALDRWWETSLRVTVAAALAARTEIQTADKPAAEPAARR